MSICTYYTYFYYFYFCDIIYFGLNTFQTQNQIAQQNENPPPYIAICPPHPSGMDQESLGSMYPILNDYLGLELSTLAQNNSIGISSQKGQTQNNAVAINFHDIPVQVTNGVRKVNN